jgi:signal transduction histidine kinase
MPHAEEPRLHETLTRRVRQSPARWWDAYLHNRTVRVRVITLLAVPLLAASLLGGLLVGRAVQDAIEADRTSALAKVTRDALVAAESLQDERDTRALHGHAVLSREINDARATSDAALRTLDRSIAELDSTALPDPTRAAVANVEQQLVNIPSIRQEFDQQQSQFDSTLDAPYSQFLRAVVELTTHAGIDSHSAREVEALTGLADAADLASAERGFTAQILRNNPPKPEASQAADLAASQFNQDRLIDRALDRAPDPELRDGLEAVRGPLRAAREQVAAGNGIDPQEWYRAATDHIEVLRGAQGMIVDMMVDEAVRRADSARLTAILTVVGLVLVLALAIGLTLAVAGSIVRPLRNLHTTALRIAKKDLPDLVNRVHEEGPKALRDADSGVRPEGNDEIGAVATAFNDVYNTAVRLTGEQALLRQNLDTIVENLSRRTQTLIDRQLREIEHLEGSEGDPDQLATLFRIDHLATRVQRHAESLLVLAGVESATKSHEPVPLLDVARAAAGEVEQYDRVRFGVLPTDLVAARAVDDIAHLIAELLDNATEFSPPATTVLVDCQRIAGGRFRITVTDQGLGIPPSRLAELNQRLGAPGDIDVAASRTQGLYVVARLAARHGIGVRLESPAKSGTVAVIDLPATVMEEHERVEIGGQAPPEAARQPAPAGAPSQQSTDARPTVASEPVGERGTPEPQRTAQGPRAAQSGLQRRGEPTEGAARLSTPQAPIRDPLTDPRLRKLPEPGRAENESPIYSALRSSWFRRAAVDGSASPDEWSSPADEGWRRAAAVAHRTESLSGSRAALPRNGTAPAPEVRRPAGAPTEQAPPESRPASPRPKLPSRIRQLSESGARAEQPTEQPTEAERTRAGLPLRQRGAALVPGTIAASRPAEEVRDASGVRSTLSTLMHGVSRGREEAQAGEPETPGENEQTPAPNER